MQFLYCINCKNVSNLILRFFGFDFLVDVLIFIDLFLSGWVDLSLFPEIYIY